MQTEVAVEVDRLLFGDGDRRPHAVVERVGVRDHDVQSVGRAALEENDQALLAKGGGGPGERRAREEARDDGGARDRQGSVAQEDSTCDRHHYLR
jgi:hypothetical protein